MNRLLGMFLALIDLAPERLSSQVLALCETLSDSETETPLQMQATTELLNLIPAAHQSTALIQLNELLAAGCRYICSWKVGPYVDRAAALRRGTSPYESSNPDSDGTFNPN